MSPRSQHSVENRAASLASEEKMSVCKTRLHIAIWCVKYVSNRNIITAQQMVSPFKSSTVTKVGNWLNGGIRGRHHLSYGVGKLPIFWERFAENGWNDFSLWHWCVRRCQEPLHFVSPPKMNLYEFWQHVSKKCFRVTRPGKINRADLLNPSRSIVDFSVSDVYDACSLRSSKISCYNLLPCE